jgi:membrane-bound serine protease (ClpP class)
MSRIRSISVLLTFLVALLPAFSQNKQPVVYVFELSEEIFKPAWRLVDKAVTEAEAQKADFILMKINTYGGEVTVADSIRTRLLNAKPVTIAMIDNNAASAGALISIACDSIYMVKGANIGAATVVDQSGQQMPDKYQSYMRSIMRSTAEVNGRDPLIAEAMVDARTMVPGVNDSGKVLTFTTSEAIKNGFCEGEVKDVREALQKAGVNNAKIIEHKVTGIDKIIAFLLSPMVNSFLLLLIFGGIYFELKTPGIGFALAVAVISAVLYFAPLYLEGLAAHWEILLFILGLILIGLEIFLFPGFGVAGISGIILIILGLTLSLINNINFNFDGVGMPVVGQTFFRVTFTLLVSLVLLFSFGGSIMKSPLFQRLVLQADQQKSEGYSIQQEKLTKLAGQQGKAFTDLRPAGKIIIDNNVFDAVTQGEFILKDTVIIVLREEGYSVIVEKA